MTTDVSPRDALKQLERVPSREPRKHPQPRTGSKPTQGDTTMKPPKEGHHDPDQQE